jgi:peroxiredoxin Q/BCP
MRLRGKNSTLQLCHVHSRPLLSMTTLNPGDPAPLFTALAVGGKYGDGTPVSLKEFKGRTLVLYFYPKDDTPGCTTQACGLRDSWVEFRGKTELFGVSIDPPKSHRRFIDKFTLPFPLLSDEKREIVGDYGVWVEKSMYGKRYMGTERSTFVIGPDSRIRAILRKVKPAEHGKELLEVLKGERLPSKRKEA